MRKLFLLLNTISLSVIAQCTGTSLNLNWEIPFSFANQAMTIEHDQKDRNYIYVAGKEQGLLIYNISGTPVKVKTISKIDVGGLDVMSVTQEGDYLYLALGNSFTNGEYPGMAIINVSTPETATVTDVWSKSSGAKKGGGQIKVEGNYAYFGAMGDGLMIFDISDKNNITYLSEFSPSISFPNPTSPDPAKYNARGMAVKNSVVYLCFDAGGLRIIDATNKLSPVQIGQYSNPALYNRPRAYNNLVLNDSLLYIAIDYCGMEILNIKNPANIKQVSWWNPWNCENPAKNNWFNSLGHTNEIQYDKGSQLVFMSSGKSDINVVSVANPSLPDSCTTFGGVSNGQGTWGLGLYKNKIYLGYIFVPLCIPFCSNWGGVKEIEFSKPTSTIDILSESAVKLFPNPTANELNIQFNTVHEKLKLQIFDMLGNNVLQKEINEDIQELTLHLTDLKNGAYFIRIQGNKISLVKRLIRQD